MKVIIMAGGYGTRLGNITETIPKPMTMVGHRPIIWHIMKLYSHYNHKDFIIGLGYKQEVIKEYFHNYHIYNNDFNIHLGPREIKTLNSHDEMDWKISLVDTGLNTLKGARLKKLEKYLDDGLNMLTYGDGVANINIDELIKFHKSHGKILTITGVHPPSRFGEIIEDNLKLVSFHEKPQTSAGLINGGFFVFDKRLLNYLTEDENCDLESGVFGELAKSGEIMVYKHIGEWECVDTERDLKHLNKLWSEGKPFWKIWE
ncbi:glucose-1-phosphate cytidylyltransferase [Candidatus Azambacteria bacterium RIFOXYD1_FULL_42_11]|uniref:Glucose-1-phosphate cytidylyltransferase n=4 Tax=Candidatus Azamiibacteriota TaxID=1752741 RepID=A0A1F5CK27_9BACT|nr:MAG: glucose-1-phosphate cytidylyltransferase [Candidatus Azambacteria bacterium RIFOXYD1_FULL_42_11]